MTTAGAAPRAAVAAAAAARWLFYGWARRWISSVTSHRSNFFDFELTLALEWPFSFFLHLTLGRRRQPDLAQLRERQRQRQRRRRQRRRRRLFYENPSFLQFTTPNPLFPPPSVSSTGWFHDYVFGLSSLS